MTVTKGHCLCGAVRFEFDGDPNWGCHCHCESCRRGCSAPYTTFMGVKKTVVRYTGADLKVYESSPGVRRFFCDHCGSPMAYECDRWPDEVHLYAASLDEPENFKPRFHVHCNEQLPWVHLDDGLPRYGGNVE